MNGQHLKRLLQDDRLDWSWAFRLAAMHGMVGIVAPILSEFLDGQWANTPEAPWLESWRKLLMHDLTQLAALEEILQRAQPHGLNPMLLKGWALHLQLYPCQAARGASDIDLLVGRAQAAAMVRCLEGLGFQFSPKRGWEETCPDVQSSFVRASEADFYRPRDKVRVDLHWSVCEPIQESIGKIRLSQALWSRTRQIRIGRALCTIPGKEEEVLLVCLHQMRGGLFLLRGLCDLARLMKANPPPNWRRLFETASTTGAGAVAYYAFRVLNQVTPEAVPAAVVKDFSRFKGPEWLLAPSLRVERLLESRGDEVTNLSLRWRGIVLARSPWRWLFYALGKMVEWLAWRLRGMLR